MVSDKANNIPRRKRADGRAAALEAILFRKLPNPGFLAQVIYVGRRNHPSF